MSVKSFFAGLEKDVFGTPSAGTIGATIENFVNSEIDQAISALKATDIGTAVANIVSLYTKSNLTGAQKLAAATTDVLPLVLKFAADPSLILTDVTDIATQLVQSTYNATISTTAGKVATAILAAAHVTVPTKV